MNTFEKQDQGKLRYSLLPKESIQNILQVLDYGAKKYQVDNWQLCEDEIRYYDAAMRHIEAWFNGEVNDTESGLSHLDHAICCLMFLRWFEHAPEQKDD